MDSYNFKTYNELFDYIAQKYNNKNFLNYIHNDKYLSISTKEFKNKVLCLALALKKIGIKKGDCVAIFTKSSPFWLIFDFAIQKIGAISVPIFDNISSKNLNFELEDANINYIFIDSFERLRDINRSVVFITHGFCVNKPNFYNVDDIFHEKNTSCNFDLLDENISKEEDTFSIIYTSGNTGTPKGVQLSHKNIINQIKQVNKILPIKNDEVILSLLPLAHIFERMVMSFYLNRGVSIYFVDDILNVSRLLKIVKPTMMTAVPRLLEKIYFKIKINIDQKPFLLKDIAKNAFIYAHEENIDKDCLKYKFFNALVYSKLREVFGGRITKLVSGGASLNEEITRFFINIGIPLFQGYGLTESSPVISTNYPSNNKIGSSGKPLEDVEVKISSNGELLTRSNSIMKGYLNNPKLTSETVDEEGWLHTGDLAYIDEDGYLFIKSRKKDIFKLSTGNYVSTIPIEQEISKNKYVEFATVIANNRQFVTVLIFVNKDLYFNNKQAMKNYSVEEFFDQDALHNSLQKTIDSINKSLNDWEKVVKYQIITKDISIEGGELTPSMKICRGVIEKKYKEAIEKMYEGGALS